MSKLVLFDKRSVWCLLVRVYRKWWNKIMQNLIKKFVHIVACFVMSFTYGTFYEEEAGIRPDNDMGKCYYYYTHGRCATYREDSWLRAVAENYETVGRTTYYGA